MQSHKLKHQNVLTSCLFSIPQQSGHRFDFSLICPLTGFFRPPFTNRWRLRPQIKDLRRSILMWRCSMYISSSDNMVYTLHAHSSLCLNLSKMYSCSDRSNSIRISKTSKAIYQIDLACRRLRQSTQRIITFSLCSDSRPN